MKRHLHRLGAAAVSGALLASLLTACGGGITAETPSVVPESPAQQTEQAVAETRTVTDAAGNVVEVPAELSASRLPCCLVLRDLCHRRHL